MATLPRPQIFLIDGYAVIYRAFFAMIARPLTTSRGENTSAAWGVANFLLRLRKEYQPDYLVWIHDAGTSFRKETYPEYKATREKLDDELQDTFDRSVERIEELLTAFRTPLVAVDGYEADDVIGTLASVASDRAVHSVIVSGDKDFYQLISPTVSLLNPGRRGPAAVQEELVTVANASERLGVPPERVVDYLALVGDSSDNVPGVRGIGEKTARKLFTEFGDLDAILEHASSITAKRPREALMAEADNARLSRALVTIQRDVPLDIDFGQLEFVEPDEEALQRIFTELEFHSLVDELKRPRAKPATEACRVATTPADLQAAVAGARAGDVLGVCCVGAPLFGVTLAMPGGVAWYIPVRDAHVLDLMSANDSPSLPPLSDPVMQPLVALLGDADVPKIGHDVKQMCLLFDRAGVALGGVVFDTMLASFLLDPGRRSHDVPLLAMEHLGAAIPSGADVLGKGKGRREWSEIPVAQAAEFAGAWGNAILGLHEKFATSLEQTHLDTLLRDVEMPLVAVLFDMERRGIRVDTVQLKQLAADFQDELSQLDLAIHEEAGAEFNINSTQQLRHVLFEKLQLPVIKKTKTGPSTDADVLAQLASHGFAVPQLLLEYRELSKLMSTYVEALPKCVDPETGRVHTSFNQTGAATGRLSSSDPNLQNIPVRSARGGLIRRCFVPDDGNKFVVADYSQVELRVLAHLSDDQAFISAFQRGGDIHRETAAIIFDVPVDEVTSEMRARAKTINFATIYGQGPFALARQLEITQEEAKEFITTYFERFAGVRAFLDSMVALAKERGYVETILGRRRYIPELKDRNFNVRSFGERTAMNSPMQGSAADLIKVAMINLSRILQRDYPRCGILLQVHDELVLEVTADEVEAVVQIVQEEMEGAADLKVPLVVDVGVGDNWLDAKS